MSATPPIAALLADLGEDILGDTGLKLRESTKAVTHDHENHFAAELKGVPEAPSDFADADTFPVVDRNFHAAHTGADEDNHKLR